MRRAQTVLEYVFLTGIVAAALIVALIYVGRGFQGRLRLQADSVGEQYSPLGMNTNMTQTTNVTRFEDTAEKKEKDGKMADISTSTRDMEITNRGNENITKKLEEEAW